MFLSILVPVFNEARRLEECLYSIKNQTFSDFEVIVIDDGSTDGSAEICDMFARLDDRFKVVHQKNAGLVDTRKTALAMAKGDYIGFVDSDDSISPIMYSRLHDEAINNEADIVICGTVYKSKDSSTNVEPAKMFGVFDKERLINEVYPCMLSYGSFFEYGIMPSLWNKIYKRDIIKDSYTVDSGVMMGEDASAVYPALLKANKVVILQNEYLYYYSIFKSSMTYSYKKWYFSSNRFVYSLLSGVNQEPWYQKQLDYYILNTSVIALKNEFLHANPRTFLERVAGVVMYIISPDVWRAFNRVDVKSLPLYLRILIFLVRKKKYISLSICIKLMNIILFIKTERS